MIDISRHVVLRLRTIEIVEHLSLTISDPSIHVHTDGLSSETNTSLKVTITSPSYDLIKLVQDSTSPHQYAGISMQCSQLPQIAK